MSVLLAPNSTVLLASQTYLEFYRIRTKALPCKHRQSVMEDIASTLNALIHPAGAKPILIQRNAECLSTAIIDCVDDGYVELVGVLSQMVSTGHAGSSSSNDEHSLSLILGGSIFRVRLGHGGQEWFVGRACHSVFREDEGHTTAVEARLKARGSTESLGEEEPWPLLRNASSYEVPAVFDARVEERHRFQVWLCGSRSPRPDPRRSEMRFDQRDHCI
jgi:hypothetical protein